MKRFFKYWLPLFLWAGFVFAVSSLPDKDIPSLFRGEDVVFHIFEYCLLALLLSRALKNSSFCGSWNKSKRTFLVILCCLIYAVSDELHQQFVPGRVSSITDFVFDSFGVFLGNIFYRW